MTQELRKLAEAATQGPWIAGDDEDSDYFLVGPHDGDEIVFRPVVKLHAQNNAEFIAAANPAAILSLLDRLEKAEKDAERLDWLEASTDMHGFCHSGYGDFRYYAHQQDGCKTVRQVIDEAMEQAND